MAANSAIEWTTHTFNCWSGCTKVSAGCQHCYAETQFSTKIRGVKWGPSGNRIVKAENGWREPLAWDRAAKKAGERHRVFCASLADVFEDWQGPMVGADGKTPGVYCERCREKTLARMPNVCLCGADTRPSTMQDVRNRLFALIDATPNLDWLLLTKRPENIGRMMPTRKEPVGTGLLPHCWRERPNLWLGTSIESAAYLHRADTLKAHFDRAAILFLSIEPLLGPMPTLGEYLDGIDWVIVGGESQHGARPMNPGWVRSIRDQCQTKEVPFFFKQWGEYGPKQVGDVCFTPVPSGVPMDEPASMFHVGKKVAGRLLDGRTWDEFPAAAAR